MESALKGLLMAAGVILTCIVIGVGFMVGREAQNTASVTVDYLNEFNNTITESSYQRYDGLEVKGSDVISFIRRNLSEYDTAEQALIYVEVVDKKRTRYQDNSFIQEIRDIKSEYYINPYNEYMGQIIRDANNVIRGVNFIRI